MSRRPGRAVLALALALMAVLALGAASARAGEWAQVACTNPDGSSALSENWTTIANTPGDGDSASATCSNTAPMTASMNTELTADPVGAYEAVEYTPPTGSTLAGGTVTVDLQPFAAGSNGAGVAAVWENAVANADAVAYCAPVGASPCTVVDGPVTLPAGGQTVIVGAECGGATGGSCTGSPYATADVSAADILLANSAIPGGSGFSGTALGTVSGTGQLLFTATDPNGPGVYNVTVAIDGTTVYSATPNTNGGACASVGTYSGTSALMFDSSQPCPVTESVDAPVPTSSIANGTHTLTAAVTDAAGNTSTVLAQTITVANPTATAPTPPPPTAPVKPAALRKIHDKVIAGWDYRHATTRVRTLRLGRKAKLPVAGRVTFACAPAAHARCPELKLKHPWVGVKHAEKLFTAIKGLRFAKGDVVQLSITAPHRKAERVVFRFHLHRVPTAHVYYGKSRLPEGKRSKGTS